MHGIYLFLVPVLQLQLFVLLGHPERLALLSGGNKDTLIFGNKNGHINAHGVFI
jgi:hypothetical protein